MYSQGFVSQAELRDMQRQVALAMLRAQLPKEVYAAYKGVVQRHGKAIDEAEAEFKTKTKQNKDRAAKGLKGAAGDAMNEDFSRLADKPYAFFTAGVDSVRTGESVRGAQPVFGLPRRD